MSSFSAAYIHFSNVAVVALYDHVLELEHEGDVHVHAALVIDNNYYTSFVLKGVGGNTVVDLLGFSLAYGSLNQSI